MYARGFRSTAEMHVAARHTLDEGARPLRGAAPLSASATGDKNAYSIQFSRLDGRLAKRHNI